MGGRARAASALLALLFIWAGMLLGISFLEAWVKFRAPTLSLEEGLDVGRQVFGALNLVEIILAAAAVALAVAGRIPRRIAAPLAVAVVIVAVQSLWLLPLLDIRVEAILAGGEPADAPYHVLYVGLEVVKLIGLLVAGVQSLRTAGTRVPGESLTVAR